MNDLRERLQTITDNGHPETHWQLIGELARDIPHSIELVEGPAPIDRYTCVMHAFDLIENQEYIEIANLAPADIFASPRFVERLISLGHLERIDQPRDGDLIVYSDGARVKHIGVLCYEDRVESKWGAGHLYRHGMFEVPSSYGPGARFFVRIGRDTALDHYVDYAAENGVRFNGDEDLI